MSNFVMLAAEWGTVPDWISAVATGGGFLLALYAYVNWKSEAHNRRIYELCESSLAKVSETFSLIRDAQNPQSYHQAVENCDYLREIHSTKAYLLSQRAALQLHKFLKHAEHTLTVKRSGTDIEHDVGRLYYAKQTLATTLEDQITPFDFTAAYYRIRHRIFVRRLKRLKNKRHGEQ